MPDDPAYRPSSREEKLAAFGRLLDVMDELREKCPWDRKQTFATLRLLSIEEVYELADAILSEDLGGIEEEIGDVTLHMIFYALLGQEAGAFDIATALNREADKLIARHPHIYGDVEVADAAEVKRNWEALKLREKGKRTVLGGVPRGLPALVKAYRMQEKTAQFGFEWNETEEVYAKVREELAELEEAVAEGGAEAQEEEFGDLLFALVNYGRFLGIDPETALERANRKFRSRFDHVEREAPKPLTAMTLAEMDALWEEAKRLEREA